MKLRTVYLVNSTWDETLDIFLAIKDERKSLTEAWSSLHGREGNFAYTAAVIKAKYSLDLVKCAVFLDPHHQSVELRALTGEVQCLLFMTQKVINQQQLSII